MAQNATLEAQLLGQKNIAQGLAELPGATTTVLNRAQAPTRRMLVDHKRLRKATSVLGQRRRLLRVGQEGRELRVGCVPERVFPNVRGALTFAVESQDAVSSTSVALGVPELEAGLSTEIDGQLFIVLSALTDGESFDIVMSAGGDHGFESWRKLHGRWNPYTAGRARSLLREIVSPIASEIA